MAYRQDSTRALEGLTMSSDGRNSHVENPEARLAAWNEQAHHCEKLLRMEDFLPCQNLGEIWAVQTSRWPDRFWLSYYPCIDPKESPARYTFAGFLELIEQIAAVLRGEYGVRLGDTVALMSFNQPLTVAIYFAAWRLGARVVPIHPAEPDGRLCAILVDSSARLFIMHAACRGDHEALDQAIEAALGADFQRCLIMDGPGRRAALVAGWEDFGATLAEVSASGVAFEPSEVSWDSDALVTYPADPQMPPTGVVLTQKQLMAAAYGISQWHALDEHAVLMNVLPLHRAAEVIFSLVTSAFVGAQLILNARFTPEGFWSKLSEHDVSTVSMIPRFMHELLERPEDCDPQAVPNFRHFVSRSQPLTVEAAAAFQDRFGLKIVYGYGLNETAGYSCFLPVSLDWHEHKEWICDHEVPSVGVPIVVNDVDVHDAEGRPLGRGQRGEIVARGHNIMAGYLNKPEATARVFRNGWFRSGYTGYKLCGNDGQDYFFVTGRAT
jgi:long-chain acyl-CoA synthetase